MMDNNSVIYLDHAAATPIDKRVLTAMMPYYSSWFFNPSSPYAQAVSVRRDYDQAKQTIASLIGAKPGEIIITAGATESINLAFNCVFGHVVVPSIEHPAVLESAKRHSYTLVPVDKGGRVNVSDIKKSIKPNTQLVSVALANNEVGTIQPISEIAAVVKSERQARQRKGDTTPIYFHCDASQGAGQIDINIARLGVDMLTLNAGKMYGPKQVGLLWIATHVKPSPIIVGGGQELGLRSGTENVAGVIGFAKALELASAHREYESKRLAALRDGMQADLIRTFHDLVVTGDNRHRLSGHLHVSFPGIDGERLVYILENKNVLVSTGSACAANKGNRSHVLTAMGVSSELADGSIRITLGRLSNEKNIKKATKIIIDQVKKEYQRIKNDS